MEQLREQQQEESTGNGVTRRRTSARNRAPSSLKRMVLRDIYSNLDDEGSPSSPGSVDSAEGIETPLTTFIKSRKEYAIPRGGLRLSFSDLAMILSLYWHSSFMGRVIARLEPEQQERSIWKIERAVYGILLSVLERPEITDTYYRYMNNYFLPALGMLVEYFQLSAANNYAIPEFISRPLEAITDNVLLFVEFPENPTKALGVMGMLVAGMFLGIFILGVQFVTEHKSQRLTDVIATYITILTGMLYLPIADKCLEVMAWAVKSEHPLEGVAAGGLMCLFIPFCFWVSQNSYEDDEHSFHLQRQRHNRLALMILLTKTLVVVAHELDPVMERVVKLLMFTVLFLAHFLTNAYYNDHINNILNGMYLCLVYGALYRLVDTVVPGVEGLEYAHWTGLPLVFVLGYSLSFNALEMWRVKVNTMLIKRFRFLDSSDNPALIHRLQLADLLCSATRIGNYAAFLATSTDDFKTAETYFQKALQIDPYHVENLGKYAIFMWDRARLEEANEMFRRAVVADPSHRENLENYAYFLNQVMNNQHEALYYYQMSIREYPEHYYYIDMYSNSADSMCILDPNAVVVDCNGATLRMLQIRTRSDLIDSCLLEELATDDERSKFKDGLDKVVIGESSVRFESLVKSRRGNIVAVETVLTRMRRGKGFAIHLSWVDITELKSLLETNQKIFECANSPMFTVDAHARIMSANNKAVTTFGYPKDEIVGAFLDIILDNVNEIRATMALDESAVVEVMAKCKSGETLVCQLRMAEVNVAGNYMAIIIMNDITELKRLLKTVTLIFEKGSTPMIMIDEKGIIQKWNECATSTLGYTAHEAIGENIKMIMPDDIAAKHDGYLARYMSTGVAHIIGSKREVVAKTKEGKYLICELKLNELQVDGSGRFFIGMLHDVSDAKRLYQTVEQIFERGSSPMILIDTKGIIQKYNESAAQTFGYSKEEAIGQNIKMLMPPDVADKHDGYLKRYMDTGVARIIGSSREVQAVAKDGTIVICDLRLNEIKVGDGSERFFVGILHDITEAKRLFETVEQIFERGSTPMIMINEQGIIQKYNESAAQTFGYSKEEAIGQNIKMLMPQDVADKHDGYLRRYVETGVKHIIGGNREVLARAKDGRTVVCDLKLNEIRVNCTGRFFVGILHDITESRRLFEIVEQIFERGSSPMIMINSQGIIQKYNECAEKVFGYSKEEAIGQNIKLLMPPDVADKHDGYLKRYMDTGVARIIGSSREVQAVAKDGTIVICDLRLNEIKVGDGSEKFFVGILHDITEAKRLFETVEQIFERGSTPMIMINEQGIIQKYNESAAQTFGYSKEETIGQNIKMLMPQDVADKHDGYLRRYVETGVAHIIGSKREVSAKAKDGRAVVCELKLNEIRVNCTGRFFVGILHDITESRKLFETVEQIFEKADSPMIMIDERGIIQKYNESAVNSFGYSKEDTMGQNIKMLMPPEMAEKHDGYLQRYKETGEKHVMGQSRQLPVITKGGDRKTCELKLSEINVAGERNYIGMLHDVTEFRRQQLFSKVQLAWKTRPRSDPTTAEPAATQPADNGTSEEPHQRDNGTSEEPHQRDNGEEPHQRDNGTGEEPHQRD